MVGTATPSLFPDITPEMSSMIPPKTIVSAAALLVAGLGAAQAADLPARVAPAPYVAPLPVFTWTGAYFGINAGASFDDTSKFALSNGVGVTPANTGIGTNRPTLFKNSDDGFTAGAQLGYNYEFQGFGAAGSGIVVGLEADAAYIDAAKTQNLILSNTAGVPSTNTFRSGIDFLGTVRGRLGYAFNQFLIYGTGGFAYGDAFEKAALYTSGNANLLRFFGSKGGIQTGYTYGGGIEYAIPTSSFLNFFKSSAVTLKLEYLRYDLGTKSFVANGVTTTTAYNVSDKTEGNIARIGLNYKF